MSTKTQIHLIGLFLFITFLLGLVNRFFNYDTFLSIFCAIVGGATTIIGVLLAIHSDEIFRKKDFDNAAVPEFGVVNCSTKENIILHVKNDGKVPIFTDLISLKNSDKIDFCLENLIIGEKHYQFIEKSYISKNEVVLIKFFKNVKSIKEFKLTISTNFNSKKRNYIFLCKGNEVRRLGNNDNESK